MRLLAVTLAFALSSLGFAPAPLPKAERAGGAAWQIDLLPLGSAPDEYEVAFVVTLAFALSSLGFAPAPLPKAERAGGAAWQIDLLPLGSAPDEYEVAFVLWPRGEGGPLYVSFFVRRGAVERAVVTGVDVSKDLRQFTGLPAPDAIKAALRAELGEGSRCRVRGQLVEIHRLLGGPVGEVEVASSGLRGSARPVARLCPTQN